MKLDWGNVLKFADEREYYEVLGFLAKDEEYIRVYTESNDKSCLLYTSDAADE